MCQLALAELRLPALVRRAQALTPVPARRPGRVRLPATMCRPRLLRLPLQTPAQRLGQLQRLVLMRPRPALLVAAQARIRALAPQPPLNQLACLQWRKSPRSRSLGIRLLDEGLLDLRGL